MASIMLWTPPRYVAEPTIAVETWEGVNPGYDVSNPRCLREGPFASCQLSERHSGRKLPEKKMIELKRAVDSKRTKKLKPKDLIVSQLKTMCKYHS